MSLWWILLVSSTKNCHSNRQGRDPINLYLSRIPFWIWFSSWRQPLEWVKCCIYSHGSRTTVLSTVTSKRILRSLQLEDLEQDLLPPLHGHSKGCRSVPKVSPVLLSWDIKVPHRKKEKKKKIPFPRILKLNLALSHASNRRKEYLGQVGGADAHSRDYKEYSEEFAAFWNRNLYPQICGICVMFRPYNHNPNAPKGWSWLKVDGVRCLWDDSGSL